MRSIPTLRRQEPARSRPKLERLEDRLVPSAYTITDLGTLGGATSSASGIFGSTVVGTADTAAGAQHAFRYANGQMTDLGTLSGGTNSSASAVYGDTVVGQSQVAGGKNHAFLYANGTMHDLGGGPGGNSQATGVNESGAVVGNWYGATFAHEHAFLYSGGKYTDLGTLGGAISDAFGINNAGEIVGYSFLRRNGGDSFGFAYVNGKMHDIGELPGAKGSAANAVNPQGQIVGYCSVAIAKMQAFLYSGGKISEVQGLHDALAINPGGVIVGIGDVNDAYISSGGTATDLNTLIPPNSGWLLQAATGISAAGDIVGYGTNPSGAQHAFLLTPAAGPSSQPLDNRLATAVPRPCLAVAGSTAAETPARSLRAPPPEVAFGDPAAPRATLPGAALPRRLIADEIFAGAGLDDPWTSLWP